MRITRDFLLKTARTHAQTKAYSDRSIICIYLTGSLLHPEPLLGGTTDIDLICIHDLPPKVTREVFPISEDIHLDLAHYPMSLFDQPRRLRSDSWLGAHMIADPKLLYESHHWFEFTQASVASKFYTPETVLERVRPMAESARRAWMEMIRAEEIDLSVLDQYLKTIETIANSLVCISAPPLTMRRFWGEYPTQIQTINAPSFAAYIPNLFMPEGTPMDTDWQTWQNDWTESLDFVGNQTSVPAFLQPCRRNYYTKAVEEIHKTNPQSALWIMLRTWVKTGMQLRSNSRFYKPLSCFFEVLGYGKTAFKERLEAMDQILDGLEEFLDGYAGQNGVVST